MLENVLITYSHFFQDSKISLTWDRNDRVKINRLSTTVWFFFLLKFILKCTIDTNTMLHSRHWWEKQLVGHSEVSVEVERIQGHQHLMSKIKNKWTTRLCSACDQSPSPAGFSFRSWSFFCSFCLFLPETLNFLFCLSSMSMGWLQASSHLCGRCGVCDLFPSLWFYT